MPTLSCFNASGRKTYHSFNTTSPSMSSSQAPTSPPNDEEIPRTIVYDPNDPFWRDTEDDDDDMDFVPAEGGSDDMEDDEGDLSFHGTYEARLDTRVSVY